MTVDAEVGIVGAGFGGLVAAVHLQEAGQRSFILFERAAGVGGTWRENVYPGCACDVPSHLYSVAAVPNPNWNHSYARQPEILAYLEKLVQQRGLAEHIRYNSDIVEAVFLPAAGCWRVTDRSGRQTTVRLLLLAMGPLNRPNIPTFPGLDSFAGKVFHSSRWDTTYDLSGKRVAVVGTGASAIQIVPSIAPVVGQLTVYQRSAAWVTPRNSRAITSLERQLFRRVPLAQRLWREGIYWLRELIGLSFLGNDTIHRLATRQALQKLDQEVHDPDTRRKLTPDYKLGCKRILVSDEYLPTFNRPNVHLETGSITRITPTGIVTADGQEHPTDVLILSTGFVAADIDFYTRIIGPEGQSLVDEWRETGAEAYRGTTVAGFPNLCLVLGPNTGLGHTSVVHMMESQMNYINGYLNLMQQAPAPAYLDLKPAVQQAYNADLHKALEKTVWTSGCQSWYQNARGRNTTLYPGLTVRFRRETRRIDPQEYVRVGAAAQPLQAEPA